MIVPCTNNVWHVLFCLRETLAMEFVPVNELCLGKGLLYPCNWPSSLIFAVSLILENVQLLHLVSMSVCCACPFLIFKIFLMKILEF
jgi:hypothetical protein